MRQSDGHFDVLIVGGGTVGLALALSLQRSLNGIRIALLDHRPLAPPADRRASAIAPDVRRALGALGLWDRLAPASTPVLAMTVTDSGPDDISRPSLLRFGGEAEAGEPIAHMVPNTELAQALLESVADAAEVFAPVEVTAFNPGPASAALTLADGRVLRAPLVVAADGARSALRDMAGIGAFEHDYRQAGIVATIGHALPHNGIAYEHFRPAGPFASLPLLGNRSSLVWTETPDTAARLRDLPDAALAEEIEAAMGSTLGAVTLEDRLQVFPLRLLLAKSFIAPRLALVGDAAHVIHPLAGQGLNLGLRDVAALAEAVVDAMRLGLDGGAESVLARYAGQRRLEVALMAGLTDGLNRLFSNDVAPLRLLRDVGLSIVDRTPLVKGALAAGAAGLGKSGPKLLAGRPL